MIPAILMGLLFLFIIYRLLLLKIRKSSVAEAEITCITPHYMEQSPIKTLWVDCEYSFQSRGKSYKGQSVLPLRHFLKAIIPPGPIIMYDVRINMSILVADDERVVGNENIEHSLLQNCSRLKVYYLVRNPSENHMAEVEGLKHYKIKNKSGHS